MLSYPVIFHYLYINNRNKNVPMEKSSFTIRSYSKSELAMLYSPYITPKAAVRKLNRWIAFKPGLQEQLRASGMLPNAKCYTPLQVHTIVEALGEP